MNNKKHLTIIKSLHTLPLTFLETITLRVQQVQQGCGRFNLFIKYLGSQQLKKS